MMKRGRPKIYYDFIKTNKITAEPIDLCLQSGLINLKQHRLALRIRWLFTINFGLPTVQAYNLGKVRGRELSKYNEDTLYEMRQEYKRVLEVLYKTNKKASKLFLNILIHHYKPSYLTSDEILYSEEKAMVKLAAKTLEDAYISKSKTMNLNEKGFKNDAKSSKGRGVLRPFERQEFVLPSVLFQ